jgi:hypothetical protein
VRSRESIARILLAGLVAAGAIPQTGRSASPVVEPGPAADALAWTIGRWEGERIESGSGDRAPLETEVTAVLGGAGEEERLEVGEPGNLYRGLYLQVFDPEIGKSVLMYVNATRRSFARMEGTAASDRGEWLSTTARAPKGSRLVYERIGLDRWRRTQLVSQDSGAHWTVLFVDEMRRSKNPRRDGRRAPAAVP